MRRALLIPLLVVAVTAAVAAARADALGPSPIQKDAGATSALLSECEPLPERLRFECYVDGLLRTIGDRNPATEVPLIDLMASATGGYVELSCHMLMHEVGRRYAKAKRLTLATLQRYIPRSDNPNCSGGFGMGLAMYLGPKLLENGPAGAYRQCATLPTRFRAYTCVHGLGHAFLRLYHGQLDDALRACRGLRHKQAADCGQGAFHDYWISLSGGDGTKRPERAVTSARELCARQDRLFVRGCWYRFFLERPPARAVATAADIPRLCAGLTGLQRAGCISAATLIAGTDPFEVAEMCARLSGRDVVNCVRAVPAQALADARGRQVRLLRSCASMPAAAARDCYAWFGRVLTIMGDGRSPCRWLGNASSRSACAEGARKAGESVVTFA